MYKIACPLQFQTAISKHWLDPGMWHYTAFWMNSCRVGSVVRQIIPALFQLVLGLDILEGRHSGNNSLNLHAYFLQSYMCHVYFYIIQSCIALKQKYQ